MSKSRAKSLFNMVVNRTLHSVRHSRIRIRFRRLAFEQMEGRRVLDGDGIIDLPIDDKPFDFSTIDFDAPPLDMRFNTPVVEGDAAGLPGLTLNDLMQLNSQLSESELAALQTSGDDFGVGEFGIGDVGFGDLVNGFPALDEATPLAGSFPPLDQVDLTGGTGLLPGVEYGGFVLIITDLNHKMIGSVKEGETFLATFVVQDLRPVPKGVFAAFLNFEFDPNRTELAGELQFSNNFPNGRSSGILENGRLSGFGGVADLFATAPTPSQKLATLPLRALKAGIVDLNVSVVKSSIEKAFLMFGNDTPHSQIANTSYLLNILGSNSTPLSESENDRADAAGLRPLQPVSPLFPETTSDISPLLNLRISGSPLAYLGDAFGSVMSVLRTIQGLERSKINTTVSVSNQWLQLVRRNSFIKLSLSVMHSDLDERDPTGAADGFIAQWQRGSRGDGRNGLAGEIGLNAWGESRLGKSGLTLNSDRWSLTEDWESELGFQVVEPKFVWRTLNRVPRLIDEPFTARDIDTHHAIIDELLADASNDSPRFIDVSRLGNLEVRDVANTVMSPATSQPRIRFVGPQAIRKMQIRAARIEAEVLRRKHAQQEKKPATTSVDAAPVSVETTERSTAVPRVLRGEAGNTRPTVADAAPPA